MAEINFLCVHKRLRAKRLAPVLIREITRRVNTTGAMQPPRTRHTHAAPFSHARFLLSDRWQAIYTAGAVLPKPITRAQYWHRSINIKKLLDVGFTRLSERMTLARSMRIHKLPDGPQITGLRPMQPADVPRVHTLLNRYLSK